MANRDAKKIERTLKDFSLGAMSGGTGGGAVIVNELPETGKVNTIYELHLFKPKSYSWVASDVIGNLEMGILVFDTYEQMTTTINVISINDTTYDTDYYAYIRNTNQMYRFYIFFPEDGDPYWTFEEQHKKEDESGTDYAFQLDAFEDYKTFYILKEFVGNIRPIADGGFECSYLTLDNKEVYLGLEGEGALIKEVETPPSYGCTKFSAYLNFIDSNHLPNSTELENDFYKLVRWQRGEATVYNTIDGKYYHNATSTENYFWYYDNITLEGYFAQNVEEVPGQEPPHYVGELEWTEVNMEDYRKYDELPYNEVINKDLYKWVFEPWAGGDEVSYWVYVNNKWVNMNDIGGPSPIIKEGSKIIVNLQARTLNLNETTTTQFAFAPYVETYAYDQRTGANINCGYYFNFGNWDYNRKIGIDLEVNEAQNQIIAYLSAYESGYWHFNQPIVVYEGDVSGLTDTSSILDYLPSELTFVLSENDFVSSMGGYIDLFNTPTTILFTDGSGEMVPIKVEY